jgi:putative transposase
MRKVLKMCLDKPLVLADGGPWYNWVFEHLGLNKQRMTFGMRSHIENIFKLVKDRTKIFSNNFGTNKGISRGIVCIEYFMKLFVFWYYFLGGGYV